MKHQTSPVSGRCSVPNLNKTSRTVPALFLAGIWTVSRNKRLAKASGFVAFLMLTLQLFAASYTVTLTGFGTFNPVGIHLNNPAGNDLNTLFPGADDGDMVFLWDCAASDFGGVVPVYSVGVGQWVPNISLSPGQGIMYVNQGPTRTATLSGNPVTPTLPSPEYCGCDKKAMLASQTPAIASWESLMGAPPANGSKLMTFDVPTQDWVTNTFENCTWSLGLPSVNVGEAVWVSVPCTNSTPCPCTPPPSGMSDWWTFDETSGTVANDTAGSVNNLGVHHGAPVFSGGAVAGALCFGSTNDYVVVSNHAEINFLGDCLTNNAESFTIDAWIRAEPNNLTLQTILDKRSNLGSVIGYSVYLSNGRLGCQVADGTFANYIAATPDLRDGQWHLIAWTLQRCTNGGNAGTLYVDGTIVHTFNDPRTGSFENTSDLQIGRHNPVFGDNHYYGCIDELEIFKRALAPSEIQAIYNAGSAGKCKTPAVSSNCCDNCVAPYPICYTNTIVPGYNFLADVLCRGMNNNLLDALAGVVDGTVVLKWNVALQSYDTMVIYDSGSGGWVDAGFNPITFLASAPGEGFVLNNPGPAYPLIICGCEPLCPPPCLTNTSGFVLVGRRGVGPAYWTNLSSCPPICGTLVEAWNGAGFDQYTYGPSGWSPTAPVVGIGRSVFVKIGTDTNCLPCTNNLVVNGSFEDPLTGTVSQWPSILGWSATDGISNPTSIELWGANYGAMAAQDGNQHLEINGDNYNVTVSQVITNVSTNCPARFCFWYTGRPGYANNTFVAEVIGSGVSPVTNNPAVYTNSNSWIQYCVDFVPTSSTLTIRFTGASGLPMAGAHIDNVSLMQCCTNPPCNEPLVVNCATNKTVDCSDAWQFDPPTAESPCCGTNITIAVTATWTNGFCPKLVSRIWQITDCLNHSVTCTQTVTVVDSTAPVFGTDCVTNTYFAGSNTSWVTPNAAFPRPALMTRLQQLWGITSTRGFDECAVNKWFAHSFTNLPKCITAAYLEIRLKPCGDICGNDAMHLWFTGSANSNAVFSQYFGGGNPRAGLTTNDWCSYGNNPQTFILDLSAMPASGAGAANLLPLLEANGFLDVTTQDDTGVDYVKLTVVSCCGIANKTVECGNQWFFDMPLATDNCCTNPTVTVLTTVTNGFCPKVITRTWRAVDCCGNAATNSQTVTVVDTTPPVVNCPSGYTRYTCDSSMVVKYNVKAIDACSGTLPVTCNPPSGYNFPVGTTIVTCTATDACGNVGTCTFPVTIVNQSVTRTNLLGRDDCFKKPKESAPKSAQLKAAHPGAIWKRFDVKKVNRPFGLSFMNLPKNLTCATLEIRMKPNCKDISSNDSISIGLNTNLTAAWTSYIGSGNPSPGLTPSVWCDVGECGQVFTFDLANMPNGGANLLPVINALGQVDIYIQDDTAVDYAKLTYCYCNVRPWWRGWDWDVSNAEIYHGDVFTLVKPVVTSSNYTVTLSPGATHGMLVGVAPLNLGSVSNASLTATAQVTGDPANGASAVKLTGDGNGKVGLSLPALSPGVTQVKLVYSLNGAVVGQSILPPTSGTNAIIIMEDGPMIRAISVTDDRALDAQDDRITVSLAGPSNTRECPMCPPTLADQITVILVNPARTPDDLFTSLSLTAEGLDEFELGETAMLAGDGWVSIRGDGEASIGDDQLTVTRQDAATTTNRMGITIHLPVTNAVSFDLSAFPNAGATGLIDVELFGIGSSGQDGVEVFNIGSSGQDGVDFFNIGSSGQDGVRVYNIGSSGQDGVDFWNLGSSGQDGVSIAARFTETNGGWNLQADFSKLGSNLELYRVYNHGVLVASLSHHGNPHFPILPGTLHVTDSDSTPIWILEWASDEIAIRINGTDYVGNELRVSPVTLDQPLGRLVVANIGSSGQDGVSIAAVTTPESVRRMLPLEDEDEELSIEWTGPAGGAIESAPALTGPWTLVPNQGGHAATAPSPQSTNAPSAQFFRVKAN